MRTVLLLLLRGAATKRGGAPFRRLMRLEELSPLHGIRKFGSVQGYESVGAIVSSTYF